MSASESKPMVRGNSCRGIMLPSRIRNGTLARGYIGRAHGRSIVKSEKGVNPMCALLWRMKRVKENGLKSEPQVGRRKEAPELARSVLDAEPVRYLLGRGW